MTDVLLRDPSENESAIRIPCEVYSRVVGYLRPVSSWHRAKRREFVDRVPFDATLARDNRRRMQRAERDGERRMDE